MTENDAETVRDINTKRDKINDNGNDKNNDTGNQIDNDKGN